MQIKTDFHLHTSDDRFDSIGYSAEDLILTAAQKGFSALAITNHDTFTFTTHLQHFAADNGILLIPGIERKIEGKHVLLLNAYAACESISTFEDLRRAKQDGLFVIAPHPFFKAGTCLEGKLLDHLELFDAVEFAFFYSRWFNLNRQGVRVAKREGLPMVGNSDCHHLHYFGICHSIIDVQALTPQGVFDAIRAQRVEIVSQPIFLPRLAWIFAHVEMVKTINRFRPRRDDRMTDRRGAGPVFSHQTKDAATASPGAASRGAAIGQTRAAGHSVIEDEWSFDEIIARPSNPVVGYERVPVKIVPPLQLIFGTQNLCKIRKECISCVLSMDQS